MEREGERVEDVKDGLEGVELAREEELVEDAAQRIHVRPHRRALTHLAHLRRPVGDGAMLEGGNADLVHVGELAELKVEENGRGGVTQDDVVRLEVAVDDRGLARVQVRHSVGE